MWCKVNGCGGTKREGKGKKRVIHEEFFSCLWRKFIQVQITSDFRDRERDRIGNDDLMEAVRDEMTKRDWQVWYGLVKGREERRGRKKGSKMATNLLPPSSVLSLIYRENYTPSKWRNKWGGKWWKERLYEKMKHLPAPRWGIRKI